ncbi:phosphoglycerate mutase-like protein 1 [Silene latifolia]|uniref:phosphoglycerate mutase-like protein 1 n=1 Tax=Silene latifolia TaxID=37657 RepID=UPI003D77B9FC
MDTSSGGQGLYPLHRCKTLHFVRHAQGFHNVAGEKDHQAYSSYDYLDASLTPLGWEQVDNLRNHVQATGLSNKIDLVIISPLTRTLQTAVGVFGGGDYSDGIDVLPLMVADAGNSGRPAISSFNCSPFLAVELCRELLGVHPCDKRKTKREYQSSFPAIDFSLIESDEDIMWREEKRETDEEVAERGMKFMKWLWSRREKEIAIVTHSGFLFHTLSAFGNDCHQIVKNEICTHFKNCELRSMILVDKSMASHDTPATNFTGKVPDGPDLPSDAVDEKLS